jgi:hypothetical protein
MMPRKLVKIMGTSRISKQNQVEPTQSENIFQFLSELIMEWGIPEATVRISNFPLQIHDLLKI